MEHIGKDYVDTKGDNNMQVNINKEKNGIEVTFPSVPDSEIRETLKANGFRWSKRLKLWYAKNTDWRLKLLDELGASDPTEKQHDEIQLGTVVTDPGYGHWEGVNCHSGLKMKEINALIRKEFKRKYPDIKVSIRSEKSTWSSSVRVTMYVRNTGLVTFEEFLEKWDTLGTRLKFEYWRNEDIGTNLNRYNQDNMKYKKDRYERLISTDSVNEELLNDRYKEAFEWLHDAFNSFNWDKSDVMTDYFNVAFYDSYSLERM